jgi:flagellar biosynthesis protein FlhA
MKLPRNGYRIKIAGSPVASGRVYPSRWLATNAGGGQGPLDGEPTRDPIHDQPAYWIGAESRSRAESQGYRPLDATSVLAAHLREVVHHHADELLTRDATRHLIEELRKNTPVVVEDLIPDVLKLGEVQQVLRRLLREDVPIRQLGAILETLGDFAPKTRDPVLLTEYARRRLARPLCTRYRDEEGRLHVVTIDPELESRIAGCCELTDEGVVVRISPVARQRLLAALSDELEALARRSLTPIVLTSPSVRYGLKALIQTGLPRVVVLSYSEITSDTRVEAVGMVDVALPQETLAESAVA